MMSKCILTAENELYLRIFWYMRKSKRELLFDSSKETVQSVHSIDNIVAADATTYHVTRLSTSFGRVRARFRKFNKNLSTFASRLRERAAKKFIAHVSNLVQSSWTRSCNYAYKDFDLNEKAFPKAKQELTMRSGSRSGKRIN